MKISLILVLTLLFSLTFLACNSTTSKGLDSGAHQQASTRTSGFHVLLTMSTVVTAMQHLNFPWQHRNKVMDIVIWLVLFVIKITRKKPNSF